MSLEVGHVRFTVVYVCVPSVPRELCGTAGHLGSESRNPRAEWWPQHSLEGDTVQFCAIAGGRP